MSVCIVGKIDRIFVCVFLTLNLSYFVWFRFSPCASKPIKQRVEAFEKLQTPQKETRTRAKALTSDSEVCLSMKRFDLFTIKISIDNINI